MWRLQIRRSGADIFTSFLHLIAEKQLVVSPEEELPKVLIHYSKFFFIFVIFSVILHFFQYFKELNRPMWDCMYCGLELSNKEDQRVHVQQSCTERPQWDDFCPYCGLEFPSKHGLVIHMSRWCEKK